MSFIDKKNYIQVIAEYKPAVKKRYRELSPYWIHAYGKALVDAISVVDDYNYVHDGPAPFIEDMKTAVSIAKNEYGLPTLLKPLYPRHRLPMGYYDQAAVMGFTACLWIAEHNTMQDAIDIRDSGMKIVHEVSTSDQYFENDWTDAWLFNRRQLFTGEIRQDIFNEEAPRVEWAQPLIAASGFWTARQVKEAHRAGADAVLIGTHFMLNTDDVKHQVFKMRNDI